MTRILRLVSPLLLCALFCANALANGKVAALRDVELAFEANAGQFDPRARFLVRTPGKRIFVVDAGMVLVLDRSSDPLDAQVVARIRFDGASLDARLEGLDRIAAITNYFETNRTITNVPNFARVRQTGVYPGIDVVYYGNQGRVEYDFVVAPGADPEQIALRLSGFDSIRQHDDGGIVLSTIAGELVMKPPVAYQESGTGRTEVPARYALSGNEVRFEIAQYDRSRSLIIDPLLTYSSFVGGSSNDFANGIALDSAGNIYITGQTFSTDFPAVGAFQTGLSGTASAFVTKLTASGTSIVYSTYIGGTKGSTGARGIAVDAAGSAYVTGITTSTGYPVTSGAYQTTRGTSTNAGFVTKLTPQGNALAYSTFVRGAPGASIAVDTAGSAFVTGTADSTFAATSGAFDTVNSGLEDAYVLKLNATGTAASYATYLGGSQTETGNGIALDAAGNAYVVGYTTSGNFPVVNPFLSTLPGNQAAFVTKLNPAGSALVYSTYLGGTNGNTSTSFRQQANAVAVNAAGEAYVTGTTFASNFPVVRAFQPAKGYTGAGHELSSQAFITQFAASGNSLIYSSYLGGKGCLGMGVTSCSSTVNKDEEGLAIAIDAAGIAYFAGKARSRAFPQVEPVQTLANQYSQSIPFVARIQDRGTYVTQLYSIALGVRDSSSTDGTATGVAVDAAGNAYVSGYVVNAFPVTPGALKVVTTFTGLSKSVVFKVSPGAFPTSISVSNNLPTSADSVTLTAFVTSPVPGGQVTFYDAGASIATAMVISGVATYSTAFNAGVHRLTAVYSVDNKVSRPLYLPVKQATN